MATRRTLLSTSAVAAGALGLTGRLELGAHLAAQPRTMAFYAGQGEERKAQLRAGLATDREAAGLAACKACRP